MNHEEAQPLLEAYFDHELGVADAVPLEAHLEGCERCREWLRERRALRARLRATPLRYRPPPGLDESLRARAQPSRRRTLAASWPRALAASLVVGLIGLWAGQWFTARRAAGQQWIDGYVRSSLDSRPLDVLSSDHHTVKPWLSARLPYSPPVPEMTAPGDQLLGARIEYVERRAIATLVYRHGKHQVDVFVWPAGERPDPAAAAGPVAGFRLESARVQDFNAVFVSDMAASELAAFRERWSALAARR
jgi:anti-sigma factor RsiW